MLKLVKFQLPLLVIVGLVIPILFALVDLWLLDRELSPGRDVASMQAMAFFVLQVGIFGVLCGRLIRPPLLLWVLFAWCLLLTDLNAFSSLSSSEIGKSLLTAQIGLVTIWVILGTSSWKTRLAVALLLMPVMMVAMVQTATLCLICLVLRSQGFRLALVDTPSNRRDPGMLVLGTSRPLQFNIKDILVWMTALAPLLAFSRFVIPEIPERRALTNGVLNAFVLVVGLWAALGRGPLWLRWPLSAVFVLIAGLTWADFEIYVHDLRWGWWGTRGLPPPWFSEDHLDFWLWHWDGILEFALAGGMLAATLLIFRVLGYRLCRDPQRPATTTYQPQQPGLPIR